MTDPVQPLSDGDGSFFYGPSLKHAARQGFSLVNTQPGEPGSVQPPRIGIWDLPRCWQRCLGSHLSHSPGAQHPAQTFSGLFARPAQEASLAEGSEKSPPPAAGTDTGRAAQVWEAAKKKVFFFFVCFSFLRGHPESHLQLVVWGCPAAWEPPAAAPLASWHEVAEPQGPGM